MNIDELRHKRPTTDAAKRDIKSFYDYHCVFSGMRKTDGITLDGAHILDAGIPRFTVLRRVPVNILPIERSLHSGEDNSLDNINGFKKRPPNDKVRYIRDHVHPDYKSQVEYQLAVLIDICEELEVRL